MVKTEGGDLSRGPWAGGQFSHMDELAPSLEPESSWSGFTSPDAEHLILVNPPDLNRVRQSLPINQAAFTPPEPPFAICAGG